MLEKRVLMLVDDTFIDKFIAEKFNSDEQFYGVKYMLFNKEKTPEELLPLLRTVPVYIQNNKTVVDYCNKLLVDLILMDYSLVDDINKLKDLEGLTDVWGNAGSTSYFRGN